MMSIMNDNNEFGTDLNGKLCESHLIAFSIEVLIPFNECALSINLIIKCELSCTTLKKMFSGDRAWLLLYLVVACWPKPDKYLTHRIPA